MLKVFPYLLPLFKRYKAISSVYNLFGKERERYNDCSEKTINEMA